MRHTIAAPLLACLALAAACGPDRSASAPAEDAAASSEAGGTPGRDRMAPQAPAANQAMPKEPGPAQGADTASAPAAADTATRVAPMIIRNGTAVVEVDSLEPAMERVRRMAVSLGGYVGNESITAGEHETRVAVMQLKIPSARFDQALAGLKPVGRLETQTTTAEDVGEEFFDVTARMDNARRLEERLVTLLATRTGKLEDVLAVERELARVREEIERYQGRLRFLRSRVALSTLDVTLHEPNPVVGDYPGQNPIVRAFGEAWRNFVNFVAWFISALGVLVPLGLILAALVWLSRRLGWRRRPPPPPPAPGPQS